MANSDRPCGFAPYGVLRRANQYVAGSACYPGDIVTLASDGQVDPATSASTLALGVCLSYAGSAGATVQVADDPAQQFVGQVAASEIDTQTDIGLVYQILNPGGDSTYKVSRSEVDGASGLTTISQVLKMIGIEPQVGNALGAQVEVIVTINAHQLGNNRSAGD